MNAVNYSDLPPMFARYTDRVIQDETLLISRPQKGDLILITKERYNQLESAQKQERVRRRFESFQSVQESIKRNGKPMTDDEIMENIRQHRKEMRSN